MKGRRKKMTAVFAVVVIAIFAWVVATPAGRGVIRVWIYPKPTTVGIDGTPYTGKGYVVIDEASQQRIAAVGENTEITPASLAKLFVAEYALAVADPNDEVSVSREALTKAKPGSSLAGIVPGTYRLQDLLAAMLVPSGNDAAYAVAEFCGGKTHPGTAGTDQRIDLFMTDLAEYLKKQGWSHTRINDPSGYDPRAVSTPSEIAAVSEKLLSRQWIRDIVKSQRYAIAPLSGQNLMMVNTNQMLNPESIYYIPEVAGLKTGSLGKIHNLAILYAKSGHDYLIVSLGSTSKASRYDDLNNLISKIGQ